MCIGYLPNGSGNLYLKEEGYSAMSEQILAAASERGFLDEQDCKLLQREKIALSYTNLTLPTNREV